MKTFVWDCPKCHRRMKTELTPDDEVTLKCEDCGWEPGGAAKKKNSVNPRAPDRRRREDPS